MDVTKFAEDGRYEDEALPAIDPLSAECWDDTGWESGPNRASTHALADKQPESPSCARPIPPQLHRDVLKCSM